MHFRVESTKGLRYKLHDKTLSGKPDMVFPKYKSLVFINGCFWHGYNCHLFKWPSSRPEFWKEKITKNKERDRKNYKILSSNWRILIIWEA
ncbi:DNA mismatch endonuclease Vsr [Bathymodiolus platifrons methanotrophic gill symbiont]|uniref:DNA mismatch endonuclease Vsr n=1 Tax=Bathymodiolus platifrons methanotrophic gill symbiont TaxID=113268 RepID=UPI001C8DDCCB|nr:DNA mismatch endonuclease Vsr [Bathymodiolus platifrons methanotrophic gill symbiont]